MLWETYNQGPIFTGSEIAKVQAVLLGELKLAERHRKSPADANTKTPPITTLLPNYSTHMLPQQECFQRAPRYSWYRPLETTRSHYPPNDSSKSDAAPTSTSLLCAFFSMPMLRPVQNHSRPTPASAAIKRLYPPRLLPLETNGHGGCGASFRKKRQSRRSGTSRWDTRSQNPGERSWRKGMRHVFRK